MTDIYNFTEQETDRQDRVDSAIANMIEELTPCGYWDWDMEVIGEVRDVLVEYIVNKKGWMTEQQFYPYREVHTVDAEQLCNAINKAVEELDLIDLAKVASDFLGGLCVWNDEDCNFTFVPDERYNGALDKKP